MDGAGTIIAVVFVALALVGGGIVAAYSSQSTSLDRGATENVTTGNIDTVAELNRSTSTYYWSDSVEVENISSGELLAATEDYDWNKNNGSITPLSSDAANTNLNVSYSYGAPSDSQKTATETISMILQAGSYIPFLLVIALVAIALAIFGGLA